MKRRVAAQIPASGAGQTLLGYLSGRFTYHSPEEWQKRIQEGELSLNGIVCRTPETVLCEGALLEYFPQNLVEPPIRSDYRILYEDDALLIIDKPGNLPVHPAGPYFNHTLWALLKEAGYGDVHFVNRLDRETSGVMLAARTTEAAKALNAQLHSMHKTYLVLVHGNFAKAFAAQGYLISDTASAVKKKRRFVISETVPTDGESAETFFTPLSVQNGLTLLRAEPRTGRFHQIRATLYSLGYPVVGDKLYGLDEGFFHRLKNGTLSAEDNAKLRIPRQALHCTKLEFVHPVTRRLMTVESPLPAEIAQLMQ